MWELMAGAALDLWVRTAAASAAPEGEIVFIMPAESLGPLLAAFEARFGALTLLPFSPRPGAPATRLLLRGIKGSRAPLKLLVQLAANAGWDVDPSDVSWTQDEDDADAEDEAAHAEEQIA